MQRASWLQILDHVMPIQMVAQLSVIMPCPNSGYDCQLLRAVLDLGDALSLLHQQRSIALQSAQDPSVASSAEQRTLAAPILHCPKVLCSTMAYPHWA